MSREWPWTLFLILTLSSNWVYGEPQVPCYFIFGDSLYDNGNNNDLPTTAKANYSPYGIDFLNATGPTGRFTNGRTTADFIAEFLGFENYIPSFAYAKGQDFLTGVNYASGGAGIRDETGSNLGAQISMNMQLLNHHTTVKRTVRILGGKKSAVEYLSKCLYTVGMGNNDYINNYLKPKFFPTSRIYTPEQYARVLIRQYSHQLKTLYKFGARKVALFGVGLLGCTPSNVAVHGTTNGSLCVDFINSAVQLFNAKLLSLVDDLNRNLQDAKFIYVDSFGIGLTTPTAGFTVSDGPCCEVADISNGSEMCVPSGSTCQNSSEYVWWDATHPTEAVIAIGAGRSYIAQLPSDTHPIDIHGLVSST